MAITDKDVKKLIDQIIGEIEKVREEDRILAKAKHDELERRLEEHIKLPSHSTA